MNNKYGVDTFADKNSPSSLDRKVILELYLAYDRKDNHGNLGRESASVSRAITIVGRQCLRTSGGARHDMCATKKLTDCHGQTNESEEDAEERNKFCTMLSFPRMELEVDNVNICGEGRPLRLLSK